MFVLKKPDWWIPEAKTTPETVYFSRRSFLQSLGILGTSLVIDNAFAKDPKITPPQYPVKRNKRFRTKHTLTDETIAARFNNYYEFHEDPEKVWKHSKGFAISPWSIEISGLVSTPKTIALEDLFTQLRASFEERVYRHRCVEAWSMVVPWTGFSLKRFITWAKPLSSARYIRFISFLRPEEALNQDTTPWYPWPYYEFLTIKEALNPLAFLATGIYGHPLPNQHGAPIRLIVPWKYGMKSIKGIAKVEFTDKEPSTFWNDVHPGEYDRILNVDPKTPHPRWSQTEERLLGTETMVPTRLYNGYAKYVRHLYKK